MVLYVLMLFFELGIFIFIRGESEMNFVVESVFSMGVEEWEYLGSYIIIEFIFLNDVSFCLIWKLYSDFFKF